MTEPVTDERVRAAAAAVADGTNLPPLSAIQRRHRHRRRAQVTAATATTLLVVGLAAALGWAVQRPSSSQPLHRTGPSRNVSTTVDFTVRYLPPNYRYVSTEHDAPPNVFDEVTRRYAPNGDPRNGVLILSVDYGRVMTLTEFRINGPLHDVTLNGRPGLAGWNTGRPGQGLFLVYTVTAPHVAVSLDMRGARLTEAEMLRVVESIQPVTSGPPPDRAIVPNTVDETLAGARLELAHSDLAVGTITHRASASVPAGTVMEQSRPTGTVARPGDSIDLVVSSGP